MKILIKENTRVQGKHLSADEVHEVEKHHGDFLIKLGRAVEHKEKAKIKSEDIVTKSDEKTEDENREFDLKKVVTKRKSKGE